MIRVRPLIASHFASDGGSMFGLVPKPIWAKRMPADELNRIPQHAHALYIEMPDGRCGLVDTGCGPAALFSERERSMHALGEGWPLEDALRTIGRTMDQIDFIILTHLHWDHAGSLVPVPGASLPFPNARLYVHANEWADALSGDPLLYKSYPESIRDALRLRPDTGVIRVTDAEPSILPGISLLRSGGHTRGHAAIELREVSCETRAGSRSFDRAVFAGDVCPTRHHLRMVFQTAYDTYPLETRAWKRDQLASLASSGGLLLFDHDPDVFGVTIRADPREEYAVVDSIPCD